MTEAARQVAREILCESGLHKAPMSFYSQNTRRYRCDWCKRPVELPSALLAAPRQPGPAGEL